MAIEADRSKTVTVECVAEANPSPSYVWTNAAGGIETHGRFLSVQNVDELGDRNYTYTCTAINILGFDKHSVLIKFTSRFPRGVLGISSDGDDRLEPNVKTQKNF